MINYRIGEKYIYPNDKTKQKFKLTEVSGFIFRFACGHWCTDNVFVDLIRCKTNIQVYKDVEFQMELNFDN